MFDKPHYKANTYLMSRAGDFQLKVSLSEQGEIVLTISVFPISLIRFDRITSISDPIDTANMFLLLKMVQTLGGYLVRLYTHLFRLQ